MDCIAIRLCYGNSQSLDSKETNNYTEKKITLRVKCLYKNSTPLIYLQETI